MGMTIDEAIETASLYDGYHALNLASAKKLKEATNVLRDAVQKIEQIMSADLEHIHHLDRDKYIVASIKEVLEDGNDD